QPVETVGYHELGAGQPVRDRRDVALGRAHHDRAARHRLVGLNHVYVSTLLSPLQGGRRDQNRVVQSVDERPGIDEFVGKKREVVVGKLRTKFDRAGRLVDLIVKGGESASGKLPAEVAVPGLDGHAATAAQIADDFLNVVFRNGEKHRDRLQLGDYHQRVGRLDIIAKVDLA